MLAFIAKYLCSSKHLPTYLDHSTQTQKTLTYIFCKIMRTYVQYKLERIPLYKHGKFSAKICLKFVLHVGSRYFIKDITNGFLYLGAVVQIHGKMFGFRKARKYLCKGSYYFTFSLVSQYPACLDPFISKKMEKS